MSVAAVWAGEVGGESGRRVRIAIVSPEIVARIRHAFASKGLDVRIDRLPMLELTIGPGGGASPAAAAFADALGRLVVDLGAAEPIVWRRRRFLRGFDMAEDVPLRPPYRVIGTGPAIGAGAALVDSLVYRQLDLEVAGAGVALAVPEEALGFVRAALAAVGRAAGEKAVAD